eukprot:scaffold10660_cov27-Tisochrysis_lutea.AAC.1
MMVSRSQRSPDVLAMPPGSSSPTATLPVPSEMSEMPSGMLGSTLRNVTRCTPASCPPAAKAILALDVL